jgi:hypothetical protein
MKVSSSPRTDDRARLALADALVNRRQEIELAVATRIFSFLPPDEVSDPEYVHGLREALSAAVEFGLSIVRSAPEVLPPVPPVLLVQARFAARNDVGLDTVLRRYFAGNVVFTDFLIEQAEEHRLQSSRLQSMLRNQAMVFDRLLSAIAEEYTRESSRRLEAVGQAERVERMLAGELLDGAGLGYDLNRNHLGAIVKGDGAEELARQLNRGLDAQVLIVCRAEGAVWAWLGSRREIDAADVMSAASSGCPAGVTLALGEPARGLPGWRLTHQQARAAMPVALSGDRQLVRYGEVALLSSILHDDTLVTSLRRIYLQPFESDRDGGRGVRETLRAYFAAERNISSAASLLGVSRQALTRRLRGIEQRLGRSIESCALHLEVALRLQGLDEAVEADRDLMAWC